MVCGHEGTVCLVDKVACFGFFDVVLHRTPLVIQSNNRVRRSRERCDEVPESGEQLVLFLANLDDDSPWAVPAFGLVNRTKTLVERSGWGNVRALANFFGNVLQTTVGLQPNHVGNIFGLQGSVNGRHGEPRVST